MNFKSRYLLLFASLLIAVSTGEQDTEIVQISYNQQTYNLYPGTIDQLPKIPSPFTTDGGVEVVTVLLKKKKYALMPVTVENGLLDLNSGAIKIGKGKQLIVDSDDFPTLGETGLHSGVELNQIITITGKSIAEITSTGRPEQASGAGFMSDDEDIISVLKGDNRLVMNLGLTHPQMAKPLFHIWNLILKEYELGNIGRDWDNIEYVLYNGHQIKFGEVYPTRGFQGSIFNDEIQGTFQINIYRELDEQELAFISEKYSYLKYEQLQELIIKLSHILTSEMEPYYVMRYGFYEGHTPYRVDPIAIAFMFGLKRIEEIEAAFMGNLYDVLTGHFTKESINN